jgi:hypothetical protein
MAQPIPRFLPTLSRLGVLLAVLLVLRPRPLAADADMDGIEPATNALIDTAFDEYNGLRFTDAEAVLRQAMALQPGMPVPGLYLQDELACQIHELSLANARDPALDARFAEATRGTRRLVDAWEAAHHDGRAKLYLGTNLGECGLVAMAEGNYIGAYGFGQQANAALIAARARDASLVEVDMGLGEYLFYCGNMVGILRLVLNLHGDVPAGIALMRTCGTSPGRGGFPARLQLAWILTEEVRDYEHALPYVQEIEFRFPGNWANEKLALDEAKGLGLDRPEARALVESVSTQWDSGWRPPAYAMLNPGSMRLSLARVYVKEKRPEDARRQLAALVHGDAGTAAKAATLMGELGPRPPAAP